MSPSNRTIASSFSTRAPRWRRYGIVLMCAMALPWSLGVNALPWGRINRGGSIDDLAARKDHTGRSTPSPKVVLVSGSNLLFGGDAPALSARLGEPVVNDALIATVGIDLIAERAAAHVGRGDIVVLAPEYSLFSDQIDEAEAVRLDFIRVFGTHIAGAGGRFPADVVYRARARGWAFVEATRAAWLAALNRVIHPGAAAIADDPNAMRFDDAGNLVQGRRPTYLRSIAFHSPAAFLAVWQADRSRVAVALDLLSVACRARGASLYAMPPIHVRPDGLAPGQYATLDRRWLDFARDRAGARPLLAPGETEFSLDDAFDTEYHLNDHGTATMTARLAFALRAALNESATRPAGGPASDR